MRLGTFTANVIVDGKALEEYDISSEGPTRVTCWVASTEGKSFAVQWKCHEEVRIAGTQGSLYVDGTGCGRAMRYPGPLGTQDTGILSSFVQTTSTQDLVFSRVQLSDDDVLLNKKIHKDLGEISLIIKRGQIVREHQRAYVEHVVPINNEKLHERSKKATVHCVGFGPRRARVYPSHIYHVISNGQPELTFVFKYRPLSVLQANGIAPRPTPADVHAGFESSAGERDPGTLDGDVSEDIKPTQLNDRIQNLENELKRLRDLQADSSEDRKPKRIKTELLERKRHLFIPGEIIDLT